MAANKRAQNGRGQIQDFSLLMLAYVWCRHQEKKILNLPPSVPRHRICDDWKGNNSNPGIRCSSIRGSFMDDGRRRSGFWPGPAVTIPRSLGPGFFPFFLKSHFWPKRQWPYHSLPDSFFLNSFFYLGRQWPYHRPVLWDRGMVIDVPV